MSSADRLRQALNLALIAAGLAFALGSPERSAPDQGGLPIANAAHSSGVWAVLFACPLGYGLFKARAGQRKRRSFRLIGWATALCALLMLLWAWAVQQGGRLVPLALVPAPDRAAASPRAREVWGV